MILQSLDQLDIFQIDEAIWIAEQKIKVPTYDFKFEQFFPCYHPVYPKKEIFVIGRFGVAENYSELYKNLKSEGIILIHNPKDYLLSSELVNWYFKIEDLTPKSVWFDTIPSVYEVEEKFNYPVFIKGSRQTNKHNASLSIANNRTELENIIREYRQNAVLHWQTFVVREFVKLRKVEAEKTEKIPASFEFRTFWWKNKLVGEGRYWKEFANYDWSKSERLAGLDIAKKAVSKLNLPFVVIDIAQKENGEWIVIECNDGQESGYAGVSPIALWQNIIEIEKKQI